MLASLVNPDDGYAKQRERHYSTGQAGDWDRLGEWNPATESVAASELDSPGGASSSVLSPEARPLALLGIPSSEDDPSLVALGREAFRRYPVQFAPYLRVAIASRQAARRYGLWVEESRGVGGLVRARTADGSGALALTCSTCHTADAGAVLADGVSNAALDLGAAMLDASRGAMDPSTAEGVASWGPGRIDVSSHTGQEPARIADVRPVAWLGYLQQDATVKQNNLTSLAMRIETLITTSQNEAVRPPRVVALALAAYLRSLAKELPKESDAAARSPVGKAVFESHCSGCHVPPALSGPPVPLPAIGTDATLGRSPDRGTGNYRVPSLHGVGTRGPLLHDGTVPSLQAMFDPTRPTPAHGERLHGSGPVPGHVFGLDLDRADRAALVNYLQAL
jgi:mono/diheme cytochrome c family protein